MNFSETPWNSRLRTPARSAHAFEKAQQTPNHLPDSLPLESHKAKSMNQVQFQTPSAAPPPQKRTLRYTKHSREQSSTTPSAHSSLSRSPSKNSTRALGPDPATLAKPEHHTHKPWLVALSNTAIHAQHLGRLDGDITTLAQEVKDLKQALAHLTAQNQAGTQQKNSKERSRWENVEDLVRENVRLQNEVAAVERGCGARGQCCKRKKDQEWSDWENMEILVRENASLRNEVATLKRAQSGRIVKTADLQ